ncbi:MAG: hypothetical protein ACRDXX_21520 [Stackebrandtia sp.]
MERVVKERIQAPRWVVDGNYNWLAETVWPLADVVLFLDPGRGTVMRRIALRSVARVITRRRLWNGNRERWSSLLSGDPAKSIIVWAWRRHPHYRRLYREMMSEPSGSKIVHFTSPTAVREFVRAVPAAANGGAG